jgi:hypothetical protein
MRRQKRGPRAAAAVLARSRTAAERQALSHTDAQDSQYAASVRRPRRRAVNRAAIEKPLVSKTV